MYEELNEHKAAFSRLYRWGLGARLIMVSWLFVDKDYP